MADFVRTELEKLSGVKRLWTIGERIHDRLADTELSIAQHFAQPGTLETAYEQHEICEVVLFHHQLQSQALYSPRQRRLLPLDDSWRNCIARLQWPTKNLPQVIGNTEQTLIDEMQLHFHLLHQNGIDEELFDLIAGFKS